MPWCSGREERLCGWEREKNQHVSSPNDIQTQKTMSSKSGWAAPSNAQSFTCTTVLIQPRTCSTIDEKIIKRKSCTKGVKFSLYERQNFSFLQNQETCLLVLWFLLSFFPIFLFLFFISFLPFFSSAVLKSPYQDDPVSRRSVLSMK